MKRLATIALLFVASCGGQTLSPQDSQAIGDAEKLCAFAYQHTDGGPIAADTRACYCALHGVLARNHVPDDDGGAARCQ